MNPMMVKGGRSVNPHGRPKGFKGVARMIMDATGDGKELVEFALTIWRDTNAPIENRWQAFQWLSDRGMGKPVAMVDLDPHEVKTPKDLAALTEAELDTIDAFFRAAKERSTNVIEAHAVEKLPAPAAIERVAGEVAGAAMDLYAELDRVKR